MLTVLQISWLLVICFVSLQLFDKTFSTFYVTFIEIIIVEKKIINAFIIFCKRCKRLLHLQIELTKYKNNITHKHVQ